MSRKTWRPTTSSKSAAAVTINAADIERARRLGPDAVDYYRRFGLAEARSRAISLTVSGILPVFGWWLLGWSATAMIIFMLVDAVITLLVDWVRLPLARPWLRASHARDHQAGEVLGIVGGLEDGTGTRSPRDNAPGPEVIVAIGSICSVFLIPITAAALEPLGLDSVRQVVAEPYFLWFVGGDAALRLLGALRSVWAARKQAPGTIMIFAESGGVAVLYAGLLVLIWLPINWGETGVLLMFAVLYLIRVAFGLFTLWWMPRTVAALERRVAGGDFSPRANTPKPPR